MSRNQEELYSINDIINKTEYEGKMSENQEAILEKSDTDLCFYCQGKAKYTDVAEIDLAKYGVVGVCQCHYVQDVS